MIQQAAQNNYKLTDCCGLRIDVGLGPVKLEKQSRGNIVVGLAVAVAGRDGLLVEELDPGDGHAAGHGLDRGLDGRPDRRERADGRDHRLRDGVELERRLRYDSERALRADEEVRQVVAR